MEEPQARPQIRPSLDKFELATDVAGVKDALQEDAFAPGPDGLIKPKQIVLHVAALLRKLGHTQIVRITAEGYGGESDQLRRLLSICLEHGSLQCMAPALLVRCLSCTQRPLLCSL